MTSGFSGRIISDIEAIIKASNDSVTIVFARNCVAAGGSRISVVHLNIPAFAKTMIVPYSVNTL
jgi:hypothetical protein